MRRPKPFLKAVLLLAAPALISASPDPVARAFAEAAAAERDAQRLEAEAKAAGDQAVRLRKEQDAAGAAILAAEAQISAAKLRSQALERQLQEHRTRLAREQRPAALLLAGMVQMSRRPPLLAIADEGSVEEFVRMRALIDTAMPEVRRRSAALAAQVEQGQRLAAQAAAANTELTRARDALRQSQNRFVALERAALARSASLGSEALSAGDTALARADAATIAQADVTGTRSAARRATELAALAPAPVRPMAGDGRAPSAPIGYQLPVTGRVMTGLSEISRNGVRSRGLLLDSARGAPVVAPAAGRIAFAGPFRSREGVVIIDHGRGWMTLLTEVRTTAKAGDRVAKGAPLGRALGDVTVELSRNGRPQPAALIARSSPMLSNGRYSG